VAVKPSALPGGAPFEAGGGTARLVGPGWTVWARSPDKFEPGTPAIVNVIAFARALQLARRYGDDAFRWPGVAAADTTSLLYRDDLEAYRGVDLLARLQATHIGRAVAVPTLTGSTSFINLDNGASTPTFAPIWAAVFAAWMQPAPVQRAIVQEAKVVCARVLGAPPANYEVLFTANTTESINLAAASLGIAAAAEAGLEPVIVTTLLEHNSNELPWRTIPGATVLHVGFDADGLIDLVEAGVVTNRRKKVHPGRIVTSFAMGTERLYRFIDDNPLVEFHPCDRTNDTSLIRKNDKVIAINSAIEVDLSGQVVADSIGFRVYSGIGGQMDFIRGAALSTGGKPVIALPSTAAGGRASRIVTSIKPGAGVVTTRGHVHWIVTEYGAVNLFGLTLRQRAEALIRIAHPDVRGDLRREFAEVRHVVLPGA
jgi:hypothetical protein